MSTKASVTKILKNALESNKILLGRDVTIKALKANKIAAVICASNCPSEWRQNIEELGKKSKVEIHEYKGNAIDLGAVCKKPFAVTVAGIVK